MNSTAIFNTTNVTSDGLNLNVLGECTGSIFAAAISGALFLASEFLPYLKSTDGNGVVHLATTYALKLLRNVRTSQSPGS